MVSLRTQTDALTLIIAERERQIKKWGTGGVESPSHPEIIKLGVLTEEFLELTREILDHGEKENKLKELVQVAAVCTAWIESLIGDEN